MTEGADVLEHNREINALIRQDENHSPVDCYYRIDLNFLF
jgi:hypothetical protein